MKKIILSLILASFLGACNFGVSKASLEQQVRADIETDFAKTASDSGIQYSIESFNLVDLGNNKFSGILNTIEDGEEFAYEVEVIVDKDTYIWKIVN